MRKSILFLLCAIVLPGIACAQSQLYPQHFDAKEITLSESPLRTAMQRNIDLLLDYDVDRLLTPFIRQAGLSDKAGSPYYGWTSQHPSFINWGERSWSLEGHVGGHYLTALALAYPVCPEGEQKQKIKERLDYMLDVLDDCQSEYDGNTEGMEGFIGGQPINHIWTGLYQKNLTPFKQYGGWVPFYCQHKVLAGLRDAWIYTDSKKAEKLFRKLCDWSVNVVSNLTEDQMQDILGWEHGGMNETLADAYRLFDDPRYLEAARKYSHRHEINGMQGAEGDYSKTFLNGQHANTQVPKFIGFERIFQEAPDDAAYRTAAHNFWDDVARHRTVCIGGNSVSEHFLAHERSHEYMTNLDGPESCNSNNMLKLSENLFDETHDARYADFYESTMWNHILSTQDPETGGYVYFTSLRPQSYRIYSQVNQGMWCCVGTGMENHSKYGHFVFTHSQDNSKLYVNLFTPCELNSEYFGVKQSTTFPYEPKSTITLTKGGRFAIAIRHPGWAADGYAVSVNGQKQTVDVVKGKASYVTIERDWKAGDVITVDLPMELRYEECPGYSDYIAFKYGPILLAARTMVTTPEEAEITGLACEELPNEYGGEGRMDHAPGSRATMRSLSSAPMLIGNREDVLDRITLKDADKLQFTIDVSSNEINTPWTTLTLEPFYGIHHARYSCYWYQQTADEYRRSDMGKADAEAQALDQRTIDFVATGEQQSEAGHEASYSLESKSGSHNGEFYRDAPQGGYIEYHLYNPEGETENLSILCRFTTDDRGRKGVITVDGDQIAEVTVPESYESNDPGGFYNIEYPIPADLMKDENGKPKESLVFRISSESTMCPGLYYLRLMRDYQDSMYKFEAKDWTTGDPGRVSADKFTYSADNTFTVNAGMGNNNVCLMLDISKCNYNVSGEDRYLVVKGSNLGTGSGNSYLWWLNGVNRASSVAPIVVKNADDNDTVVAWDLALTGLDGNCRGSLYSICAGKTIFGLTSTTGTSRISYIGFLKSPDELTAGVGELDSSEKVINPDMPVDIYTADGKLIVNNEKFSDARRTLTHGVYIVNGMKVGL